MVLSACDGIPGNASLGRIKILSQIGVGTVPPLRTASCDAGWSYVTATPGRTPRIKDETMRCFLLLATMILPVAPALAEVTLTNDRGGNTIISRDCTRAEGQATCTRQSVFSGPEGTTASKVKVRTAERGYLATSVTTTGPQGNTRTRDRSLTRGN